MIILSNEETKQSLISEVLKWASLSKGGKFIGLGIILLVISALLIFCCTLYPSKYPLPTGLWLLWFIGEMLLMTGVIVVIVGVLVVVLGLIAFFRAYRSKRVQG